MAAAKPNKRSARFRSQHRHGKGLHVSIIGAGRLGTALAILLKQAGYRLDVVVTNHAATARRAGARAGALALSSAQLDRQNDAAQRLANSDLIIIATPDDAIAQVAVGLAKLFRGGALPANRKAKTVLHTSGALSSEILSPLRAAGFAIGSLHPLVSVARVTSPEVFQGAYFCIEGETRAVRVARAIVKELGGHSFSISSEAKPLYHAAASVASGHLVVVYDLATEMLVRCGVSPRRAQTILLPLVESTLKNIRAKGPAQAMTGPLARGDFATVRKHLAAIRANDLHEAAEIYASIGKRALRLGENLTTKHDRIARLLTSGRRRM